MSPLCPALKQVEDVLAWSPSWDVRVVQGGRGRKVATGRERETEGGREKERGRGRLRFILPTPTPNWPHAVAQERGNLATGGQSGESPWCSLLGTDTGLGLPL